MMKDTRSTIPMACNAAPPRLAQRVSDRFELMPMIEQHVSQVAAGSASWKLLRQGSPEAFIDALCSDAMEHPAVEHPYLPRLAAGDLPDTPAAILDFCHQYHFYSAEFPSYLEAVIAGLRAPKHREMVLQNLQEERGRDSANLDCIPHAELFQRFRRAAGVTKEYDAATSPCSTVLIWRDLFQQMCGSRQVGVGLGAIGIATEMIVSTIYRYLHLAVTRHTNMTPTDYLFLTLHLDCDDGHGDQMKQISIELAEDPNQREALRFGVLSSLNLRSAFWDVMLARATAR